MRLRLALVAALTGAALLGISGTASASHSLWQQDFSTDTTDWSAPITHNAGDGTATVEDGSFSRFGQYRATWPGDYFAEVDVYLDPSWSGGTGFDYIVASSNSSGGHLRDFVFHVGVVEDGRLLVNADNNNYGPNINTFILKGGAPLEIDSAGWYTLQHRFYDNGGTLAVDMSVLDSNGTVLATWTRTNAADVMAVVGGNRYAWFVFVDVDGGLDIDNHELYLDAPHNPLTKDDCKDGGWEEYGFSNQGQCIRFVQTGQDSR